MTDRPNSDPSAEMREVLAELVLLQHSTLDFIPNEEWKRRWIAAWERARAILSAQPETCVALFYNAPCGQELDGNRHVTCANRIQGLHAPRIGCHEFVPPVSQPSTTSEKS